MLYISDIDSSKILTTHCISALHLGYRFLKDINNTVYELNH